MASQADLEIIQYSMRTAACPLQAEGPAW